MSISIGWILGGVYDRLGEGESDRQQIMLLQCLIGRLSFCAYIYIST